MSQWIGSRPTWTGIVDKRTMLRVRHDSTTGLFVCQRMAGIIWEKRRSGHSIFGCGNNWMCGATIEEATSVVRLTHDKITSVLFHYDEETHWSSPERDGKIWLAHGKNFGTYYLWDHRGRWGETETLEQAIHDIDNKPREHRQFKPRVTVPTIEVEPSFYDSRKAHENNGLYHSIYNRVFRANKPME